MAILTQEVCRHVLWYYGAEGGVQPGSFTQALMQAIKTADGGNKAKLVQVFPEYVAALELPIELLQAVARGDDPED
jgi:hypothetical protein